MGSVVHIKTGCTELPNNSWWCVFSKSFLLNTTAYINQGVDTHQSLMGKQKLHPSISIHINAHIRYVHTVGARIGKILRHPYLNLFKLKNVFTVQHVFWMNVLGSPWWWSLFTSHHQAQRSLVNVLLQLQLSPENVIIMNSTACLWARPTFVFISQIYRHESSCMNFLSTGTEREREKKSPL